MSNEGVGVFRELFNLLRNNPTVEEVQDLISNDPDVVTEKSGEGVSLLHQAAFCGASLEVVRLLLDQYPNAVNERNVWGRMPLHDAAVGASAEVVQLLLEAYPDAVKEGDENRALPLHHAAYSGASLEVVQLLLEAYPDAVKEGDENRVLPLHHAAYSGASLEVVQLLLDQYPDAVNERNVWRRMPLHDAAVGGSAEVVQLLLEAHPDAVKEGAEKNEYLPLHTAAAHGASLEVVQLLLEAHPDAVKIKDNAGNLPLHLAAKFGASASEEVLKLLIIPYPDAVKIKNNAGNLPLHLAARFGASEEVLKLLIKAYPNAVKEKDSNGNMPISRPDIKEIYNRDVTFVVQNLPRSQSLLGDHAKGKDLLGVKEEAKAIADTIAFKDLQTPFVVGILGGWGSGKSFTFNLIEEHLKEIQKYNLATEVIKLDFPYVGHIYLIKFDVWTFAKGNLWSSLMDCILTGLNDQLDLEEKIGPDLLKKGVSVIELLDEFITSGDRKYLEEVLRDGSAQQALREWTPRGGNIIEALINATNSNYVNEVRELAEKKQQLLQLTVKKKQQLAWEDVIAEVNSTFPKEIKELVKDAYEQYAEENPGEVPLSVDAAMNSMKRWKGYCGGAMKCWDLLWAGRLSPLWVTVFLSSLILAVAVVIPLVLDNDKVGAITTAIGPVVSGLYACYNDARAKLRSAQAEISKVASEMHLDKEQFQKALNAANEAQLRRDENDEERQQDNIEMLNAEINSLEDRVWLRKGDSLNKVVADRIGSSNYEEHLGVVHQAQADLKHISDAIFRSSNREGSFPRGEPRIVLFIDDLDRCPPKKVVETLEAIKLLVKTKLFVVVLAIDAQYVTLCLEKEYKDVLRPERHPSGLDYVEKIVQLPYRVPPIGAEFMKSYLREQMNAEEEDIRELSALTEVSFVGRLSRIVSSFQKYFFASNELVSSASAEVRDESGSHGDNQSPGQPNAEPPILSENSENATDEAASDEEAQAPITETEQSEPQDQEPSPGAEESKRDDDIPSPPDNATDEATSDRDTQTIGTAPSEPEAVPLPTEVLEFTGKELQSLEDACVLSGVGPRSAKRLVNVFKLMKIIWYRRDQTPGVDTPHEVSMKEACVLILALCASNSKILRREMCKVLAKIEQTSSMPVNCGNLKDFVRKALGGVDGTPLTKINSEECKRILEKVKWEDDEEWRLVKNDLRLLRCFSFVGEYNESVEDIHRELRARGEAEKEKGIERWC